MKAPIVFAPHFDKPDPSEHYECLPISGYRWPRIDLYTYRFAQDFSAGKIEPGPPARREEVLGDHLIMSGFLLFRPRKTGFIICLN